MAEDGHHIEVKPLEKRPTISTAAANNDISTAKASSERNGSSASTKAEGGLEKSLTYDPPMSPRDYQRNPFSRQQTSLDVDDYFVSSIFVASLR